jgi:hypothetical protein
VHCSVVSRHPAGPQEHPGGAAPLLTKEFSVMRFAETRAAALALVAAGFGAFGVSSPAAAQASPTAYAFGLSAFIASGGTGTMISPIGKTAGGGGKSFSHTALVPLFSESLGLAAAGKPVGAAAIVTSGITAHVSSNGSAGATVQIEGDTALASLQITVELTPPAGSTQPAPAPLLTVTASNIASQVMDTQTLPAVAVQTGTASFGSLSITGSMVGGQTLTFQGDAPANTVLYDDPNMTITLNQQVVTGSIDCTPLCQFVPSKMVGDALAIEFSKKTLYRKTTTSGQIVVGENEAGLP